MNLFGNEEAKAREALRKAVDHDVDLVLRACLPLDWKEGPFTEEKMATGCMHPLADLKIEKLDPEPINAPPIRISCRLCETVISQQMLAVRVDEWKKQHGYNGDVRA